MIQISRLSQSVIYSAIRENGKSLQYVADSINLHRATLSRKLAAETIQLNELKQIAQTLEIPLKDLFNRIAP